MCLAMLLVDRMHLQEKCDKNWIPTKLSNNKNILPHKIYFWVGCKKWVGW